jgi:hypothetical protein
MKSATPARPPQRVWKLLLLALRQVGLAKREVPAGHNEQQGRNLKLVAQPFLLDADATEDNNLALVRGVLFQQHAAGAAREAQLRALVVARERAALAAARLRVATAVAVAAPPKLVAEPVEPVVRQLGREGVSGEAREEAVLVYLRPEPGGDRWPVWEPQCCNCK